jgi:hypothetical protein
MLMDRLQGAILLSDEDLLSSTTFGDETFAYAPDPFDRSPAAWNQDSTRFRR